MATSTSRMPSPRGVVEQRLLERRPVRLARSEQRDGLQHHDALRRPESRDATLLEPLAAGLQVERLVVVRAVGSGSMKAQTRSPRRSSGSPTTTACATPGCAVRCASTSAASMFSPPRMITSLSRPVMRSRPSRSMTPRSPVRNQSPSSSLTVASTVRSGSVYPQNSSGPLTCTSPATSAPVSPPAGSTVRTRVSPMGRPSVCERVIVSSLPSAVVTVGASVDP